MCVCAGEREDYLKVFKEFCPLSKHFINFNIFYFLLRESAKPLLPPLNDLKLF